MTTPFPNPRLRALFGVPLAEVDRLALENLAASLGEEFDLEFHKSLYASDAKSRHEVAKDIAAMTERGGVIVLGLAERTKTTEGHLIDVDLSDAVAQSILQIVATRVAPLPEFELLRVPADAQTGQWLIVVPQSPHVPHAVSKPGESGLYYFTRHGTTTRELSESEIADRYRRRFAAGEQAASRAGSIFADGITRLSRAGKTWLAMAIVPDRPGNVDINRAELERHRKWCETWQPSAPQSGVDLVAMRAHTVGFRRLIVSKQMGYHGTSEYGHCELHADGSGFIAHVVGQPIDPAVVESLGNVRIETREHVVDQGDLAHVLIAMLSLLSAQCVTFAGASGDGTLVASLITGGDADGRVDQRAAHLLEQTPTGPRRVPSSRPVRLPSQSWRTTPLSVIAVDARELVSTAHGVIADVLSEFGQSDWTGTTASGDLFSEGFGQRNAQLISQWGRNEGLVT